jgi:ketosteroid isomerase-like protein
LCQPECGGLPIQQFRDLPEKVLSAVNNIEYPTQLANGATIFDNLRASVDCPYASHYAWFFTMRDDKVVTTLAFFESLEFNEFWTRVSRSAPP